MTRTQPAPTRLQAVDDRDAEGFCAHSHSRAVFRFDNCRPARGQEAIRPALIRFFAVIADVAHTVEAMWDTGDAVITQGRVPCTRSDGSERTVPLAHIWHMEGDRVREYRFFGDVSVP